LYAIAQVAPALQGGAPCCSWPPVPTSKAAYTSMGKVLDQAALLMRFIIALRVCIGPSS